MERKLNIGCGHVALPTEEGWINLDANEWPHAQIQATVPPIPLEDEYLDHILASHFIEHVEDTITLMNECHRVLKPGGTMQIYVPYALSHAAFQDPTHIKFFVPESFMYYTDQMAYLRYGIKVWSSAPAFLQDNGWVVEALLTK